MDADEATGRAREIAQEFELKRHGGTAQGLLVAMSELADESADTRPEDWPVVTYGLVQALRRQADAFEATLIRTLREDGSTWAEVAEAVDSHLSSRQAAQAKWKRLLDENRRVYGGPGRGGRPRRVTGEDEAPAGDAVNESVTNGDA